MQEAFKTSEVLEFIQQAKGNISTSLTDIKKDVALLLASVQNLGDSLEGKEDEHEEDSSEWCAIVDQQKELQQHSAQLEQALAAVSVAINKITIRGY
jgi:hypothetical protein